METIEKRSDREGNNEPFTLKVTKTIHKSLFYYAKEYDFDIYQPIRTFLSEMLIPKLKEAAKNEDEKIKKRIVDENEVPTLP